PIHRWSQVTGGVSTNARRMASAIGTSTACPQYRTPTTSTPPAQGPHGFKGCPGTSINPNSTTVRQHRRVQKRTDTARVEHDPTVESSSTRRVAYRPVVP